MSCEQTHQKDTETHAAARLFGGGDARARDTQRASPGGHSARRTLALDGNALDSGGSLWRTLSRRACGGRAAGGSLRRTRSQQRVRRAAAARAAGSEWRVAVHCHRPRQPATCARERQRAPAAAARDERPRQLRMPGFARPVSLGRANLMRSARCTSPRVNVLSSGRRSGGSCSGASCSVAAAMAAGSEAAAMEAAREGLGMAAGRVGVVRATAMGAVELAGGRAAAATEVATVVVVMAAAMVVVGRAHVRRTSSLERRVLSLVRQMLPHVRQNFAARATDFCRTCDKFSTHVRHECV
jgi:hypothetical protein